MGVLRPARLLSLPPNGRGEIGTVEASGGAIPPDDGRSQAKVGGLISEAPRAHQTVQCRQGHGFGQQKGKYIMMVFLNKHE